MKKDEKKSRMVNFRLSEMEYESFKNNVAATCGSDNGAVSRGLQNICDCHVFLFQSMVDYRTWKRES